MPGRTGWSGWVDGSRSQLGAWTRRRVGCSSSCARKGAGRAKSSSPRLRREKGTGDLGRLRFATLLAKGEERMLLELKEADRSAIDLARNREIPVAQRARVQTAAIRGMQGDPWPRVAGAHLGTFPVLVREIEP